jgi:hypothetical protein
VKAAKPYIWRAQDSARRREPKEGRKKHTSTMTSFYKAVFGCFTCSNADRKHWARVNEKWEHYNGVIAEFKKVFMRREFLYEYWGECWCRQFMNGIESSPLLVQKKKEFYYFDYNSARNSGGNFFSRNYWNESEMRFLFDKVLKFFVKNY